ncbi:MAG: hypothetical protein HYU36_10785 [Planctomycetes bacterium]|nr:hypothetical protein [Planctomycetota bacterium]
MLSLSLCAMVTVAPWTFGVRQASGCWADIPMETLLQKADLVVMGEIVRVEGGIDRQCGDSNRYYAVGLIQVTETLKGKKTEEVKLIWPATRPAAKPAAAAPASAAEGQEAKRVAAPVARLTITSEMVSTDIVYQKGQKGLWILKRDKDSDAYWADYPKDLQKESERDNIVKTLKGNSGKEQAGPELKQLQVICD